MSIAGYLSLVLLPYVQAPPVAPYSLSSSEATSLAKIEASFYKKKQEGKLEKLTPIVEMGLEFYRKTLIPTTRFGAGFDLRFPNLRFRVLPDLVYSLSKDWESAPQGGLIYGLYLSAAVDLESVSWELFNRSYGSMDRGLGDPEGLTQLHQNASYITGLKFKYGGGSEGGLFASLKCEWVALGGSTLGASGFNLSLNSEKFIAGTVELGWRAKNISYSVGAFLSTADVSKDALAYNSRGAFNDKYLSKQYIELGARWHF